MKLVVSVDGKLSIDEADNFRGFHVEPANALGERWAAVPEFASIATPAEEADHFWLDADAVAGLPERADAEWREKFWAMLKKVEPYGYADMALRRVKAHVSRPSGQG